MNRDISVQKKNGAMTECILTVLLCLFIPLSVVFTVLFVVQNASLSDLESPVDQNGDLGNPSVPEAPSDSQGGEHNGPAQPPAFVRDPNKKYVALTYDDGPHNVRTEQIVDELDKYGYHATFFVVGNRVDGTAYSGASAMKYAAEKGNEIAIHGYTHDVYYDRCEESVYFEELRMTERAIWEVLPNYEVKLMRPIGGNITAERVSICPYGVIMWSVDSEDWRHKSDADASQIVDNVMSQVEDGSIILMHDLYENTYEATKIILERLHAEGYEVVTVSELLGSSLQAGQKYYEYTYEN